MSGDLTFIPQSEFTRLAGLNLGPARHTALFADLTRLNTLSMIAHAGSGHIGSSFSSLDIVSWLYLQELNSPEAAKAGTGDVYFSSKGHDAPGYYAALIALGLLPQSALKTLRRLGGLPGHPDVGTDHIIANTGSLGMGISKAKGMAFADRLAGRERRYYVMTGDGELQEGQIWESLVSAANHGLGSIAVLVDHNKLQSDIPVASTSDLGDLEAKFEAFGWHVERCDGHDLDALAACLRSAKAARGKPQVIICDTVKGKGVSFMEATGTETHHALYGFHSGAASNEDYARGVTELLERVNGALAAVGADPVSVETADRPPRAATPAAERMVPAYTEALIAEAEKNPGLVALDGDLVLDTGLIPFRDRFPDRFLECGIAEQDMVSQAGGMALSGLTPVVHSFACFLAARPAEQIYNNASEHTKVVYVGSLAGALPGGPGHSHQAVNDIAVLGAIPGMLMAEPCCAAEVAPLLGHLLDGHSGCGYLRLVSIPCPIPYSLPDHYRPEAGIGVELRPGADAVIIGYGPVMLPQAWNAAELLATRDGLDVAVVNLPWLNRIDSAWLTDVISGKRLIATIDNHLAGGGLGRTVGHALAEAGSDVSLVSFGLTEFPVCGQNDEVLRAHGLDAASLADAIASRLKH